MFYIRQKYMQKKTKQKKENVSKNFWYIYMYIFISKVS